MVKFRLRHFSSPQKSIVRWFLICFTCFSLIFFIALLPLISYCRSVFTELEIKKSTQQMDFGISQLENTISGAASASHNLRNDPRFTPFLYLEPDFSAIPFSVYGQIMEYLYALTFPLTLVTDSALQFSDSVAITPQAAIYGKNNNYYPNRFQVEDLSYEKWEALLTDNKSGFLPVCRVTSRGTTYDALIYSIPWNNNSYTKASFFYVCMNMEDVKEALIAESTLDNYYLTIENDRGTVLYTNLTDNQAKYHSVTQKTSIGGLTITVHIPYSALTERMSPLYYFLGLYLVMCALALMVTAFIGSHLSSKPLLKIVGMLESSDTPAARWPPQSPTGSFGEINGADTLSPNISSGLHYGFHYIQNKVHSYESKLNMYHNTIATQQKVLQARFLEKALHGSLATEKEYEQFFSYFPDFPESFCLVQLGLLEQPIDNDTLYDDALSLIQVYIQGSLPKAYLQQLNSSQLLMIIDEKDFTDYSHILNHLIENINREEVSYHAWGIVSKFYSHPTSLSLAYWQLTDLYSRISVDSLSQLCSVSDCPAARRTSIQMSDVLSLHTAITCGNKDLALAKLQSFFDSPNTCSRSAIGIICSVLLCIKGDYAAQLIDVNIPSYRAHQDMYGELAETISIFCDELRALREQTEINPFMQKVKAYIDLHFTEYDLCLTSLAEQFSCSTSKIQKAFSKEFGIAVSVYIEKKRMNLANELLLQNQYSIAEVARKCGFTNDNTFYKAYRRTFGHAPTSLKGM